MSMTNNSGPVDAQGRPLIKKLGVIDFDIVETNPVVFGGDVWRFEYIRYKTTSRYWDNKLGKSYFRFVNHESGKVTSPFAFDMHMGCAFVDGDTVYVTCTRGWGDHRIEVYASRDMENWETWNALDLPGYGMHNTSVCKAGDKYVMMFEIDSPPEETGVKFTARFATSKNMKQWEVTAAECCYDKSRYSAPHCLRYVDGYYYNFYLAGSYETQFDQHVARSKDLINWEDSPLNPVLSFDNDDRHILNADLPAEKLAAVKDIVNINNSDIDFCEYDGKLIINYSWGDQRGTEVLAEAAYEGTAEQFMKGWFPE